MSGGIVEMGSTRDKVNKLLEKCAKQQGGPGRVLDTVQHIESEESHYARLVRHQQRKLLRSMQHKQLQLQQKQKLKQQEQQRESRAHRNQKIRPRSKSEDNWECKPYQSDHSPPTDVRRGRRGDRVLHGGRSGSVTMEEDEEGQNGSPVDSLNVNEKLLLSRKKDAEIAALLHHLRLDAASPERSTDGKGSDGALSEQSCNFERSLGYFP